jgi:hypothetical protein
LGNQDSTFAAITGIYKILTLLVSATSSAGASATFTFAGDVVQIFGTSGPNDAPYSVQLDGGSSLTFNATKLEAHEQVLLYYADNLGPGSHNVKIVNQPALSGQSLNINYALVDSVPSAPTRYLHVFTNCVYPITSLLRQYCQRVGTYKSILFVYS